MFANLFGFSYGGIIVAAAFVLVYTSAGIRPKAHLISWQGVVMVTVPTHSRPVRRQRANTVIETKNIRRLLLHGAHSNALYYRSQCLRRKPALWCAVHRICSCMGVGHSDGRRFFCWFTAIRSEHEFGRSRRVAIIWVVISMAAAVFIGVVGRSVVGLICSVQQRRREYFHRRRL